MDADTLKKANALNKKITEFSEALNCFEYVPEEGAQPISLNPALIIEFDYDGREQIKLPFHLSNALIDFLKSEITKGLNSAKIEFDNL